MEGLDKCIICQALPFHTFITNLGIPFKANGYIYKRDDELTFLSLQTRKDTSANSEDPDETDRNEPSHRDLHCLPFCILVCIDSCICSTGNAQFQ